MPNSADTIYANDNANVQVGDRITINHAEDRWLANLRLSDPRDDKARIEQTKSGLLKALYRWILDYPDFLRWCNGDQTCMLWIKGDPGKGKTMLLCGIINELTPSTILGNKTATTLLSHFLCQASEERINNATAVLRGLISLLVDQQPSLVAYKQKKHDPAGMS
jgi:hypothetical protein